MQRDVLDRIEKRAHFVAGRQPWFRGEHDAAAESAVKDVKLFLNRLPPNLKEPTVSGGTTASSETIITLTWLISGYTTIKLVSVSFKGNDRCDVYWDEPVGGAEKRNNISVDEVAKLDLPQKINSLINSAPGASPTGPAL